MNKRDSPGIIWRDHLNNMSIMDPEHRDRGGRIEITNQSHGINPLENHFGRIMVEENHEIITIVIMITPGTGGMTNIRINTIMIIQTNPIMDINHRTIKGGLGNLVQITIIRTIKIDKKSEHTLSTNKNMKETENSMNNINMDLDTV